MKLEALTPLQESSSKTGRRFFACELNTYKLLCKSIDESRGYPIGVGTKAVTENGLPNADSLQKDKKGRVLISIETSRFTKEDEKMLEPAISAGYVEELVFEDYQKLLPEVLNLIK